MLICHHLRTLLSHHVDGRCSVPRRDLRHRGRIAHAQPADPGDFQRRVDHAPNPARTYRMIQRRREVQYVISPKDLVLHCALEDCLPGRVSKVAAEPPPRPLDVLVGDINHPINISVCTIATPTECTERRLLQELEDLHAPERQRSCIIRRQRERPRRIRISSA